MPEACMICLDNSEYMRNGDFAPTRLEAQSDAANMLCGNKTQSHPENTVGILVTAGNPEVLVSPTSDLGKMLAAVATVKSCGDSDFMKSIQVAQLALKHRQDKHQRQRIVIFVGSPVTSNTRDLVRLAKRMKKNNISVDVINFGEDMENVEKLEAFIEAVNKEGTSHLLSVPAGPHALSELVLSSPIAEDGAGGGAGTSSGGGQLDEFGVDPNIDPELALALRLSMQDEQARQAAAAQGEGGSSGNAADNADGSGAQASDGSGDADADALAGMDVDDEERRMLEEAIRMSMMDTTLQDAPAHDANASSEATYTADQDAGNGDDEMMIDEDEELRLALAMSMQDQGGSTENQGDDGTQDDAEGGDDVDDVLRQLPGADGADESKDG